MRFGNELFAAYWHAGVRILDASDIRDLKLKGEFEYHPPITVPSHTIVPVPVRHNGNQIAVVVDEEMEHIKGQLHAGLWFFDIEDRAEIKPISVFHLSERDSPFAASGLRFGAHQFQEHVNGDIIYCAWFSGGLRMIDIKDPAAPTEVGWFIPEPPAGYAAPQSNDVFVDERGLVYLIDRNNGLDIMEPSI